MLTGGVPGDAVALKFDTELTSLNLSGGPFLMPLASDPGNALGDSLSGYGLVNSQVSVTLSSQRPVDPGVPSMGVACAMWYGQPPAAAAAGRYTECDFWPATPINPEAFDGEPFYVQSFFDIFFDITVTDVDPRPGRDFAGQPDGASIVLPDTGPAGLDSSYTATFDKDVPNFGLIPPPEFSPYIGHFQIEIPLGGDLNGNGENDKIKFTLATHSVGDENRTFIQLPDGTVVDSFDSGAVLEGAVVDESTDPPFTIGALDPDTGLPDPAVFGGPTTASSTLQNEVIERDLFEHSLAEVVLQWPDGATESVTLAGPTLMHVTFDGPMNGSAVDDDGDGLDDLRAEMVALELSGASSAGPIMVRLDPTHRSMGELEERTNLTPGTLDVVPFATGGEVASFFDVFFEVRLPDGTALHGDQPARMQTKIHHKPPAPGETYQYAFAYVNPIQLLDENNNPTGIALLDERHTARPEIEIDYFPYSLAQLTLNDGQGNTETVVLAGPSTVHVTIPADGMAADTDGDGRDQVPTQLVQLELRGTSSLFGPILVTLDPNRPSRGMIQEQINSTPGVLDLDPFGAGGAADSFFDVFPRIFAGGESLYTEVPLHIATVITHKPPAPGETYASGAAVGPPVDVLVSAADAGAAAALPPACTVPDNGTGTIFLPPTGCAYLSPDEVHLILDGLPPGSTIELAPIHKDFICRDAGGGESCVVDDGDPTNGETELFDSTLEFEMRGTGILAGFQRTITIPNVVALVQSGPRQPGNLVQGFDTEMMQLQGQITGDPDFDLLQVTAGTGYGLPSPGHTTLTSLPGGNWAVDSFFDITYRIDFVGAPGGPFGGQSGSTTGTVRMRAAGPAQPAEGVELIGEWGDPTGVFVTQEAHTPNAEIEIDVFPNSLAQIVLQTPNGPETVTLAGPTTVEVVIPPNGMAADTDGNGLDQVPTTMTQLDLRGSSSLGPVHVRLDPNRATFGQIEEQQNNTPGTLDVNPFTPTGLADSFFDVFFEIEVGGNVLRTAGSVRMQSVISHKPPAPGETYVNPFTQPVPLLDANGNPTGLYLLQEIHIPNPENKIEIDYYEETTALVQLAGGPLGPDPKNFILTGPAEIHVLFDGPNEGDAIDSDGDGLEDVATQLVGMNLTDGNVTLRVRDAAQSPYQATRGEIEERENNTPHVLDVSPFTPTGSAVSFFDVFFELDVAGVGVLHNEQGLRVRSTIYEKPPYRRYIHVIPPDGPIELYDENNQPTGVRLLQAEHDTGKVEIDVFPETVGQIQIEVPNPPVVVTPNASLPPLEGVYLTAADVHATFHGPDLEVVLQDVRHRPFAIQPVQIAIVGNDEVERFQSSLRATVTVNSAALGLDGTPIPVEFLGPVVTRVSGKAGQTTGTFDTEMLSMSLSGQIQTPEGSLEVKLRESPSRPSKGRTSVSRLPDGNFQIDSFFDVFTELSVDGGRTWIPTDAPVHVQAQNSGIQAANPELPPNDGIYRTPGQVHAEYQGADLQIVLQDVRHSAFRDVERQVVGSDEVEQFQSTVVGIATISGQGLDRYMTEVALDGLVTTVVRGKANKTTGFFDTEMLQLDLTGQIQLPGSSAPLNVTLRESPTRASTGRTSIRALGNGNYHIDSFFDVFTELTVDGGQTWTPSTTSAGVELTAPPRLETIDVVGPATVAVFFEGPNEGDATDEVYDGFGRDEVQTGILELDMRGSSALGPVIVTQRPGYRSPGQIEEYQQIVPGRLDVPPFGPAGSQAYSWFYVWPQIEIGGRTLVTSQALLIDTFLKHKPPQDGERYESPQPVRVPLLDANGNLTGAYVVREIHQPDPTTEVDQLAETTALVQLVGGPIGPQPTPFLLRGPAEVHVYFDGADEGDAVDDDGDGLDEVVTQLVSMNLTDGNVTMRVRDIRESPTLPSLGRIEERVNDTPGTLDLAPFTATGLADSFFDVFFEIQVGDQVLHNEQPLHVAAVIDHKPPIARYIHFLPPSGPIELIGEDGVGTGVFLVNAEHYTGHLEVDHFEATAASVELIDPRGNSSLLRLSGPSTAHVFFEGAEGQADDDDANGREEVRTELVQLDLHGDSPLGPVAVRLDSRNASAGAIEETDNDTLGTLDVPPFTATGTADSFFDVFFEIEVAGRLMYPQWAKRMSSVIDHKPPGEGTVYENPEIIPLVDAAGNLTGYSIGRTRHIPVPKDFIEVDVMPDTTALVQLVGGPLGNLPVPLILHGSSEAHVFFEGPLEGDAEDDDGDGRDDVATQLTSLNLTNGAVTLRLNSAQATLGQIEELVNNHAGLLDLDPFALGDADSFFDVFFEIELPDQTVVHNGAPLRIQAMISEKPPLARYIHLIPPAGPIELLNANNLPTGVFLVSAEHYTGHIERDVMEQTTALLQLRGIPGSTAVTSFVLNGPSVADVYFEAAEGQARDDDGDGRDEVETELVAMNLTDGNITLRLNPAQVSAGQIEEQANATPGTLDVAPFTAAGQADSFFDVFFEIELPDGSAVHNQRPLRVQAVIDHKPPIARYIHILPDDGPIELLDADNGPTGVYLVSAVHYTGKIEVDHFENSLAVIDLIDPRGNSQTVQLTGPSTAHVYFEGSEGQADDDSANGREEVATEMVQMNLQGSSSFGPVSVRLNPRLPSPGQIEETGNATPGTLDVPPFTAAGTADSFFDIFFEIQVGNRLLYPAKAKRMSSVIDHKPPGAGTVYENPETIPLLDATGRPTGFAIGATRHIPVPEDFVEVDVMPDTTALVQLVGGPLGNLPVPLILHGSSEAHVFFEGPIEGDAGDDDGDGRDEVATQLTSLNLTNGAVTLRLNSAQATLGQIEELVNNHVGRLDLDPFAPGDADSFFDVFFEIELPDQTVVHNGAPLRIQAMISEKPPLARYIHLIPPAGPIELLNANNLPTGVFLVSAEHYTGHIERDVMEQTTALLQLRGIPGSTAVTSFVLNGPSVADVYFEAAEGQAGDDDGDGRDEVETKLVGMNLTDGNITLRLNPAQVSAGQIEEQANATPGTLDVAPFTTAGQADSFFDVFFEIELPDGSAVHNQRPVRVQAVIDHKPPIARYIHILPDDGPIELLDADNGPTGVYLVSAVHYTGKIEVDHFENSLAMIDLIGPQGNSQTVQLSGPSTAHVFFEGSEGQADDDTANGRDEVATELVQLDLSGRSSLGPVSVRLNPRLPSQGQIEEQYNVEAGVLDVPPFTANCTADSFFDVFFEIQVGNRLLYPAKAKRMSSVIDHKPPGAGTVYESPEVIPLLDAAGRPTGFAIGATRHIPVPEDFVEVDEMPDTTALVQLVGGPLGNLPVPLILHGSSEAHVFFEGPIEGDAGDDDEDGRDEVATQLTSLNLTNGAVTLRLNSAQATLGQIEELVNNHAGLLDLDPFAPGDADSFFDVFFEIELPDQTIVHNGAPLRIQTVISEKPPLARYIHLIPPSGPIELLNAGNQPTGVFLVQAEHYTGHIERDVMEQTTALLQLRGIPGSTAVTSFVLNGPSVADVYFEAAEGQARDDDGDGRDEVETELVAMNLTDGNITLRLNPAQVSAGQIEEQANATPGTLDVAPFTTAGRADSFFDVFFEIELPDGSAVHNQRPVRVQAVIDHKPPIARYIHLLPDDGPIELFDEENDPTGVYLVRAAHYTGKIEVDHFENSLAEIELISPSGVSQLVQLGGPSTAHVYFEGAEGQADDDNANGREEVATELVQLDLSGRSSLGPMSVRLDSRVRSTGQIEENANATAGVLDVPPFAAGGTADSFFDVFFEIQVGNRVLYPAKAKRLSSVIDHKPPGAGVVYESREVIPLLDAAGRPTGYAIGATRHIPAPRRAADIVGRDPSGTWWLERSIGTSFVNEQWGQWDPTPWHDVAVGDVNGDGKTDVVGRADWGDWWVGLSNGSNLVNQKWGNWAPISWLDVHVADVNGDGQADIVGRTDWGDWWVAKANITGTGFVNELWGHWDPIDWQDVQVGDFNGDGLADIVGRTDRGDWWVAKAHSTGTRFVNEQWGHWDPVAWHDVAVGDVNGDGQTDIVGRTDEGDWWVAAANATGTGFVNQKWGFWSPIPWLDVQVADVTGDGRADILGRTQSGAWWVAKANDTGTGFVNQPWGVWPLDAWLDVQTADVSGDGRVDIVGRNGAGEWWVARTNDAGTGSVSGLWGQWAPITWSDVHAADITGPDSGPALMALRAPSTPAAAQPLGQEQLSLVVEQAILHWEEAGLTAAPLAAFRDVQVVIADLPGLQLGMATSSAIVLDVNAAGYGWSVEIDPQDRETAASRMDLLTAVLHELGHVAGLADDYGAVDSADVMSGWLLPGVRRLPTLADVDAVFGDSDWIAD